MLFNAKLLINAAGIILTVVGALILVLRSPMLSDITDTGNTANNWADNPKNTRPKYDYFRIGGYLIIAGSIIQFISNSLP